MCWLSTYHSDRRGQGLKVMILERAVSRGPEPQREYAPKVRVPEPQHFKDTQNEKEIDNFLWHMERYTRRCG